ncbi:hypothetical protein V5799_031688 [Amblyomma americanum]|uniref:Uncharacterized protein n=1 Tax=Amblyomma americanum TaxID=6943 RepID=A0AAQ4DTB0_AMBAM
MDDELCFISFIRGQGFSDVRSLNFQQNHAITEELPQQRRLAPDLQEKARNLLRLKANKVHRRGPPSSLSAL